MCSLYGIENNVSNALRDSIQPTQSSCIRSFMSIANNSNHPGPNSSRLPAFELDPSLYNPTPEEVKFLKSQTKIEDDEELKQHVLAVQKEAWSVRSHFMPS